MMHSCCITSNFAQTWWRHQMETFSVLLALCARNSSVTGELPSQRPVTRSFDVSLICALNKRLSKNRKAGDLRRHRPHYDVIVLKAVPYYHRHHTTEGLWIWHHWYMFLLPCIYRRYRFIHCINSLQRYVSFANILANFTRKHDSHWLDALQQHPIAVAM